MDLVLRIRPHAHSEDLCQQDHAELEEPSILLSALLHTARTLALILAITFLLNLAFELGADTFLGSLLPPIPVVRELITALIGLIPSCSASVFLTELYSSGLLSAGALLSGLCTNAGIGLLVLFRQNRHVKQNLLIVGILYLCGVLGGLAAGLFF